MHHHTRWLRPFLGGLACLTLMFLLFSLHLQSDVKILDPRFKVLAVRIMRGTNHWMYEGSQWKGMLRDFVNRTGLPVAQPSRVGGYSPTNSYTLFVAYTGNFSAEELDKLRPELTAGDGTVIPLKWSSMVSNSKTRDHSGFWTLERPPTSNDKCFLRLKTATSTGYVAEIHLSASDRSSTRRPTR